MIRPLLIYPNPLLRQVSQPVDFEKNNPAYIATVARDLIDTMVDNEGAGLSAIQIGIPVRIIAIMALGIKPEVFINPEPVSYPGEYVPPAERVLEGCLSFPGQFIRVDRYALFRFRYRDPQNVEHFRSLDGVPAQAVQHEIEHLDGKLLIDHASKLKREFMTKRMKKYHRMVRRTGKVLTPEGN